MRSYASTLRQPMLPAWVEYVQYAHPVDEVLLQRLERAEQPVPGMAAFLQDDLAIMVVEGLLDQIELMKRQHISALEQIERLGKCKAPAFKELMVEPKQARALSQRPQELAWAPAHTVASVRMDPVPLHRVQELDIPAEPMAELLLEASNQIMSDASAVPAPDVPGPSKHHRGQKPQADTSKMDVVNFPSNVPA
ncbi:hypothetical protein C0995_012329 [Termitomyces sp. Mi166|nr:hypothetical protein C0995_012329 [Termitomyces sp. Mi166\